MRRYLILLGAVAFLGLAPRAAAQGSQPFIGEILIVPYNFAPQGFALCEGQLQSIAQNTALFALIGTTYGGDGVSTFALPDLRGRVPIHQGGAYIIGELGGEESVTLSISQIPAHDHAISGQSAVGTTSIPTGSVWASQSHLSAYSSASPDMSMNLASVSSTGGNQPHDNRSPYLTVNYIIAVNGIFPSRD
jgi:microcystin-dependent protein